MAATTVGLTGAAAWLAAGGIAGGALAKAGYGIIQGVQNQRLNDQQAKYMLYSNAARDAVGIADLGVKLWKNARANKDNQMPYNNEILQTPKSYEQLQLNIAQRYPWYYRPQFPANLPPDIMKDMNFLQDLLKWKQMQNAPANLPPDVPKFTPSTEPTKPTEPKDLKETKKTTPVLSIKIPLDDAPATPEREQANKLDPSLNHATKSPQEQINEQAKKEEESKKPLSHFENRAKIHLVMNEDPDSDADLFNDINV